MLSFGEVGLGKLHQRVHYSPEGKLSCNGPSAPLELVCAGSDNGASPWPCPHVKEICTTRKHCLSRLPLLQAQHGELILAWKNNNGNLQPPYLSCIKVRAFLTQVLALMPWSSVCALWFKGFLQQKAIQNSERKHRKSRAWSVILSQLVETCCQLTDIFHSSEIVMEVNVHLLPQLA